MKIAIQVQHPAWWIALPEVQRVTRKAAKAAFAMEPHPECGELSVVLADDAMLRALNSNYRGVDKSTNVLAFAYNDAAESAVLGDVIISLERTTSEAKEAGLSLSEHLSHLVVHGVLHLFGYDHSNDGDAETMEALEIRALAEIGIADPYAPSGAVKCNER